MSLHEILWIFLVKMISYSAEWNNILTTTLPQQEMDFTGGETMIHPIDSFFVHIPSS